MDKIGLDKALHFVVSFLVAVVVMMGVYYFSADRTLGQVAGFGVAMLVGVGKEIMDTNTTGFDWWDVVADLCGAVVAVVFGFGL